MAATKQSTGEKVWSLNGCEGSLCLASSTPRFPFWAAGFPWRRRGTLLIWIATRKGNLLYNISYVVYYGARGERFRFTSEFGKGRTYSKPSKNFVIKFGMEFLAGLYRSCDSSWLFFPIWLWYIVHQWTGEGNYLGRRSIHALKRCS